MIKQAEGPKELLANLKQTMYIYINNIIILCIHINIYHQNHFSSLSLPLDLQLPLRNRGYRVFRERLGEGSFAKVKRCESEETGQTYAMKVRAGLFGS